jgi:hypothetical protein
MASFKSHPFFYTSLLLIGAVTAGEAWLIFSQRSQAAKLTAEIEQKEQALQAFSRQQPFPSRENVAAVEADRQEAEKTRDEIRKLLRATGEVADKIEAASVPNTSADAWYVIADYVERVRATAQAAHVGLPAENRLGFALYAGTGPERELIPAVFRQLQYADYLMGVLIAARPREILSLHRERPLTEAQKRQNAEGAGSGLAPSYSSAAEAGDFFTMDPRTSARVPGFVETSPFRFSFVGTTSSLRSVLNQLAKFELPVVVRSVEVESLNKQEPAARSRPSAANPFALFGETGEGAPAAVETEKPLIEQTDSRFVVTVEFISLVDKTPANGEESAESNP